MEQISRPDKIDCDTPVTIIVKRKPKPDRIEEFEQVMSDTTKDAMEFEGHLGANIIRPTKKGDYYRIVFKFDSMRNYMAWESSAIRQQWLQRYAEVEQGEQEMEILSGLETWFTLSGEEALVPPPKYKMMVIVWISIFPLSLFMHYGLIPFITGLPVIAQIAITSIILVMLMTYVVMPFMSRILHKWLHCARN